ncbi:hypothetical protein KZX45_13540 [Georgenia sp. EYE_87]|uniref:ATP-grasp domain-containing protein n=1 Tax=Georgenia sp. EYE_87 TaxID=2853448 RepID=UPI0020064109|nr:hypothetical protein [Georgenia sp. EYE_87]MCK6211568.1 hypothetical protein [Georgenia sp. EYE_87]
MQIAIAIATIAEIPPSFDDDRRLAEALRLRGADAVQLPWDQPGVDWRAFDAVVIRSTWDYSARREEFVAWADTVGDRLHNAPDLVRWNSDKRYLQDLVDAGVPVVPTVYVAPGDPVPALRGEVVVKPTVSAGARDTGRFGEAFHDLARRLVERIHGSGRTAMIQPYQRAVDTSGETAVVLVDGVVSNVLRKRAVLRADEVAPVREDGLGAAEAMYDPALVTAGEATDAELRLAARIVEAVADRFRYVPLYARVDMVADDGGAPLLMELEAVEPNLYLDAAPGSVDRVADAVVARVRRADAAAARPEPDGP